MADTTFVDGSTKVIATWLNDVNIATYRGTHTSSGNATYDVPTGYRHTFTINGQYIIQASVGVAGNSFLEVSKNDAIINVNANRGGGSSAILSLSSQGPNGAAPTGLVQANSPFYAFAGIRQAEYPNGRQGVVTLVAGSATVANTSITAFSRIFLTSQSGGGTPGWVRVSAIVPGTSFTITSSSGTDTSVIAYTIFEP